MIRNTSFGSIEVLLEKDSKVVSELLKFERDGRSHIHSKVWEICYVLEGSGVIVNGDDRVEVEKGSVCRIPPGNAHWMIPNDYLEILLVYSTEGPVK